MTPTIARQKLAQAREGTHCHSQQEWLEIVEVLMLDLRLRAGVCVLTKAQDRIAQLELFPTEKPL
jgi:hypothetical protein